MRNIEIEGLVRNLEQIERSRFYHPAVVHAMQLVDAVIAPYRQKLVQKNVLVTYHGSLQYQDPVNLDLDLAFTTLDKKTEKAVYRPVILKLEDEFLELPNWPKMGRNRGRCDTNFAIFSIEELRQDAKQINKQGEYDEEECTELHAAYILTSRILFPEQFGLAQNFKTEIDSILATSPVLTQAVIGCLNETISIRKERKNR